MLLPQPRSSQTPSESTFRPGFNTMELQEIVSFIDNRVAQQRGTGLNPLQKRIIEQCYQGKTYNEMEIEGYSLDFIKKIRAPQLWKLLSEVIGEEVTKKNLLIVLESALKNHRPFNRVSTVIGGRYKVIQQLNDGEWRKLYVAQNLEMNNALCVIEQLLGQASESGKKNFEREVDTLYRLGWYPQLPKLLAHYEELDNFYLVYQYVEGKVLSQELREEHLSQPWDEYSVIKFLRGLLNILEFVHQYNIVHLNIKPSNIIQKLDGQIVLINFSLARDIKTQKERNFWGTPGYMAPEQSYGLLKMSSDIYAAGIIGIQALTGIPPKKLEVNDETGEIIWRNLAKVSSHLANILDKMTSADVKNRYQSVKEIGQELNNFGLADLMSNLKS